MTDLFQNLRSYFGQIRAGAGTLKNLHLSQLRKVFSLMGKREKTALTFLAFLAIASFYLSLRGVYYHYSTPIAASGGSYTEGLIGQPGLINPLLARQEPDLSLTKLVFSGLYKYDNNGRLMPDLADGLPAVSDDQKQYLVKLKTNVKWHNGKPFSADDVVFTMRALQDPAYKSPLRSLWQSTTVEKLDDYTVKFTTKDVVGPFVQNLTLAILPKAVWSRLPAQNFSLSDGNLKAVGTGPYAIREIKKQVGGKVSQISLNAFNSYYGGQAKIANLVVKFFDTENDAQNALRSREIQGFGFVSPVASLPLDQNPGNWQILRLPLPQYQIMFFNLNNKILTDAGVRKALTLATDRRAIIRDVFGDQALLPTSPLLINQGIASRPQTAPADLAAAKNLLEQAGWKLNPKTGRREKKNQPLALTLTTSESPANSQAAAQLAGQWRQLNITVNLNAIPTKQLTDSVIRPRNFDALLFMEKFNSDPDPFAFWHSSQIKDPGFNLTGFSDPSVDKLITQARTTTDQGARQQIYQKLDERIAAQNPIILIDQAAYLYAVDSNVKNIGLKSLYEPAQRFYDIGNWYIEQTRVWK